MGITGCPSKAECGPIQLLSTPLRWYHVHDSREAAGSLLHDESDRAMHRSGCLDRLLILLTTRIWRANGTCHNYFTGTDCIHDGVYRKCAENFRGDATDRQVFRYCSGAGDRSPGRDLLHFESVPPRSWKRDAQMVPQAYFRYSWSHVAGHAVRRAHKDEAWG